MAFSQKQIAEIYPLNEISFATLTPGAVGSGTTVTVAATAFTLGNSGTTSPATFALGDQLEIWPSAGANINGIVVSAAPTATPGTALVTFYNGTGGSVTPTAGAKYTIVAIRLAANIVS
jgi:hypothetical protein